MITCPGISVLIVAMYSCVTLITCLLFILFSNMTVWIETCSLLEFSYAAPTLTV